MAKQTFSVGQTLTAAQMTSLQQTAMLGGAASAKTASYTLVAADAGTAISMNSASATTITVNTSLFAAGDTVHITNLGAGVCTITAGTATVNSSASLALAQYESGFLDFTSTSAAIFVKGAGAAATSGGMTSIATGSLSGSTLDIGSIPNTYNQLFLEVSDFYTSVNGYGVYVRITGVTTGYKGAALRNYTGSVTTAANGTTNFSEQLNIGPKNTDNNNYMCLTFPNYTSAMRKVAYGYGVFVDSASGFDQSMMVSGVDSTSQISSLTILCEPGGGATFSGGTYTLWGIK